jgi:hypothetical protein
MGGFSGCLARLSRRPIISLQVGAPCPSSWLSPDLVGGLSRPTIAAGAGIGGPDKKPGHDVDTPGEKHWHGATPTTAMIHIAIQEALDGKVVDWMEKVSDAQ